MGEAVLLVEVVGRERWVDCQLEPILVFNRPQLIAVLEQLEGAVSMVAEANIVADHLELSQQTWPSQIRLHTRRHHTHEHDDSTQ